MANPNCVVKNSQRKMVFVDDFASSDNERVTAKTEEFKAMGYITRTSSYKIGPRKSPIIMHKVTAYKK